MFTASLQSRVPRPTALPPKLALRPSFHIWSGISRLCFIFDRLCHDCAVPLHWTISSHRYLIVIDAFILSSCLSLTFEVEASPLVYYHPRPAARLHSALLDSITVPPAHHAVFTLRPGSTAVSHGQSGPSSDNDKQWSRNLPLRSVFRLYRSHLDPGIRCFERSRLCRRHVE